MDFTTYNQITGQGANEDDKAFIYVHVQAEFFPIDEAALTRHIQQWMLDNAQDVISTTAERHEQVSTTTPLPALPDQG
jgi:hypothetical protein